MSDSVRRTEQALQKAFDFLPLPSPKVSRRLIRMIYERNEYVRGCVDDLVRRVSTAHWRATPKRVERFLKHPCVELTFRSFVATLVQDLLLYNSVAIEVVYSLSRRAILELVPVSTKNLKPRRDPVTNIPNGWLWSPPNDSISEPIEFELDELYPIILYPSLDRWNGVSPIEAIIDQVTVLVENWNDAAGGALSGRIPAGVLLLIGASSREIDRAKEELESDDPVKVLAAERAQWIEFKRRLDPQEFRELMNAAREIVYDAFGRAVGRSGSETSARVASIQARGSDESMYLPLCITISEALTTVLEKHHAEVFIWPREWTDRWREARTLHTLTDAQILSKEEARLLMGLPGVFNVEHS